MSVSAPTACEYVSVAAEIQAAASTLVWPPPNRVESARGRALYAARRSPRVPVPLQESAPQWQQPHASPDTHARLGVLRRGRQAAIVPAQAVVAGPAFVPAKLGAARRLLSGGQRGMRTFPVQPQIPVPPAIPRNGAPAGRPLAALVRGRRQLRPLAEHDASSRSPRARPVLRFPAFARGRQPHPVDTQPAVSPRRAPRPMLAAATKGKQRPIVPAAGGVPPIYPVVRSAARRLLSGMQHGHQAPVVPPQIPVPPTVPGNRWSTARSKIAAVRRARASNPVLTQATAGPPAYPPPKLGAARRLLSGAQRGRRTLPIPSQVPVPPMSPGNRGARARFVATVRGRRTGLAATQDTPLARRRTPSNVAVPPRARRQDPPRVQDTPTVARAARRPAAPPPRGHRTVPPVTQAAAPPPWPPAKLGAARRLLSGSQRGRRADAAAAQVPVPKWPTTTIRSRPRWGWLRRGRRQEPGWGQPVAPPQPSQPIQVTVTPVAATQATVEQLHPAQVTVTPLPPIEIVT